MASGDGNVSNGVVEAQEGDSTRSNLPSTSTTGASWKGGTNLAFEEMLHAPSTLNSALRLIKKNVKKLVRDNPEMADVNGNSRQLRSSDKNESKEGVQKQVDSSCAADTSIEDSQDGEGLLPVQNLLNLYAKGRKHESELVKKERSDQLELSDTENSDSWEEGLLNDILDEEESQSMSNFSKYTVPQYDLKNRLYRCHYKKIEQLSISDTVNLCNEILPDLDKIRTEELSSTRHQIFKNQHLSNPSLREMTVAEPFNNGQDRRVTSLIMDNVFANYDLFANNGEALHYLNNVLVPEALIRIFAKANNIDFDLAEKELRFQARYGGELPPDVIATIPKLESELKAEREMSSRSKRQRARSKKKANL